MPASLETWYVNDSDVLSLQQTYNNFILHRASSMFPLHLNLYTPFSPSFPTYQSRLCADNECKRVAMPMIYVNQVNFYDFNTQTRKSISVYKDASINTANTSERVYYCGACSDETKVYALYMNQDNEDSYEKRQPTEIHVFSFDGNFIRRFAVREYLIDIVCDNKGNLYGLNLDNEIYKYQL